MKLKKKFFIEVLQDIRSPFLILMGALGITVILSIYKGIYSSTDFWSGFLVNLHNSLLDVFIFGIMLTFFTKKIDISREIRMHKDTIEEYRDLQTQDVSHKIAHCIRKLSDYGIENVNLTRCYLEGAKLEPIDGESIQLVGAKLMGAKLARARMKKINLEKADLQGANLCGSNLQGANLIQACLKNIKCSETDFKSANLGGANLTRAKLENSTFQNANFKKADLSEVSFKDSQFHDSNFKGVLNLDIHKLMECKSLKRAKFDKHIWEEIKKINPDLLRK
ncbi:pentapeptide repeat-containing protein [Bacillus cereus group sp. MYBK5-1]|uniref:pentapeptide repeat-containing protein n=1 Tax=Bacillus cereus group sp. MYBK5-1 TaxID=3450623 RepID=UPI003F7B1AE3